MKKFINTDQVNQIQFYQMPKVFFQKSKYAGMRNEAKIAYMLFRDLLPLSIKNNWVNKEGEVFVKLSRTKLMDLLNIKGTQKAAQIMKELVDHELIVYKCIGLSKCNEIYVRMPEGTLSEDENKEGPEVEDIGTCDNHTPEGSKILPEEVSKSNTKGHESQTHIKTNSIKTNHTKTNISPSVSQRAEAKIIAKEIKTEKKSERKTVDNIKALEDLRAVNALLETQLHVDDLKQQHDPDFIDEIANNICEMYLSDTTRIGNQNKPQPIIRGVLSKLKMYHIEHVVEQFDKATAKFEIYNPKGYLQTMIYNSICEANTKIKGDIRYNFGY